MSVGDVSACAVLSGDSIQCWGSRALGNSNTTNSSVPVSVSGITDATAVAAGAYHACAVLSSGSVQCWGGNNDGDLGNGTTTSSSVPVTVSAITTATAVTVGVHDGAGYSCACALLIGGTIQCWGDYRDGNFGSSGTSSTVPVTVSGITNAIAVGASISSTCVVLSSGSVQCLGNNSGGMLGDGTTTNSSVPVTVSGF